MVQWNVTYVWCGVVNERSDLVYVPTGALVVLYPQCMIKGTIYVSKTRQIEAIVGILHCDTVRCNFLCNNQRLDHILVKVDHLLSL